MTPPSIVLVGLMGTGKTTTARLLSRTLRLPMTDSDAYLREHYDASAAHIVDSEGTAVLHEHEVDHVIGALTQPRQVIAAAASVVENPRARKALAAAFVVWLDAPDDVLDDRVRSARHRPKFDSATLRRRREPYLREVADLRVEVVDTSPEEVVRQIVDAVSALAVKSAADGGAGHGSAAGTGHEST
ncbi:MAG TPA: shikimate kinase [Stackebrandtia sp.]|jgi:shikimate kinase|uniref:shikimate kinase n=1 Tax=Stackebrandtia sp. TaxID=2023065 RepID=UPI002D3C7BD4|nr:shikimate kinase [Stackebrandtia sp.]HZE40150.1 shikimate kinase [Stackebrandtia sp.]